MTDSVYAEGMVVIERRWNQAVGRSRRPRNGWTLHWDDCFQVRKAAMPAPAVPYPDTVPCRYCRPGDPHRYVWVTNPDGTVTYTCKGCDITATGNGLKTANSRMHRLHDAAMAAKAVAEAEAAGGVELLVVPRDRGPYRYTAHRSTCGLLARINNARPAPADLDSHTVACTYCRPEGVDVAPPATAHVKSRQRRPDGSTRITCSCGADTGWRRNDNSARSRWVRQHSTPNQERKAS